jgi:hypothetical protein
MTWIAYILFILILFLTTVKLGCNELFGTAQIISLYEWYNIQVALVIRELAFSHLKNDLKSQFSSQKWTFYLRIQDSRSKMMERIYPE